VLILNNDEIERLLGIEITCFANNVGTGLQFAAAGAAVLSKARKMKIGTELPDDWFSENVHP
jgi:hypothetical protein